MGRIWKELYFSSASGWGLDNSFGQFLSLKSLSLVFSDEMSDPAHIWNLFHGSFKAFWSWVLKHCFLGRYACFGEWYYRQAVCSLLVGSLVPGIIMVTHQWWIHCRVLHQPRCGEGQRALLAEVFCSVRRMPWPLGLERWSAGLLWGWSGQDCLHTGQMWLALALSLVNTSCLITFLHKKQTLHTISPEVK